MAIESLTLAPADLLKVVLGRWMGRREAFALMAGRCSAADVASLKRMRDEKIYKILDCTWTQFCTRYLHVSRRTTDRLISFLEEFGPSYFHIAQLSYISAKDYRQIKQYISDEGVNADGRMIALLPENGEELSAAIRELLSRIEIEAKESLPAAVTFEVALKRCQNVIETLQAMTAGLDVQQKEALAGAIAEIARVAASAGFAQAA